MKERKKMKVKIENEGTLKQNIFCNTGFQVYSWYNGNHNEIGWSDESFLILNKEELFELKEMVDFIVEKII